jgi:hypothetical protein
MNKRKNGETQPETVSFFRHNISMYCTIVQYIHLAPLEELGHEIDLKHFDKNECF